MSFRNIERTVRLVVVDDDTNLLDALKRSFEKRFRDWKCDFFSDARKAIQAIENMDADNEYDFLATDIQMPGLDGVRLLNQVANSNPNIRRIAFSGNFNALTVYSLTENSHLFLTKPFSGGKLAGLIEDQLSEEEYLMRQADELVNEKNNSERERTDLNQTAKKRRKFNRKRLAEIGITCGSEIPQILKV